MITTSCRLCASNDLARVVDLGQHPLADTFLPPEALSEPEIRYPLRILLCNTCGYAMSEYVVPPEERYQKTEYSYDSSNSPVAEKHFAELAQKIAAHVDVSTPVMAVDAGSNVGTLLGYLKDKGLEVTGVEPAANIAALAEERGIPTIGRFFDDEAVERIKRKGVPVKVVSATNVFNHLEDVHGALSRMDALLASDGVIALEVPYLLTLLERTAFDTVYLEHVSYFSLAPHLPVFKKYGFYPYRVELNDYMGGSILVILGRDGSKQAPESEALLAREANEGARDPAAYAAFMERVRTLKYNLLTELIALKRQGKRIAGLGAATKGNTLLNYCGITNDLLECVLDTSPLKIGKYMPGSRLSIRAEASLDSSITHLLILPWNIGAYLKQKLSHLPVEFIVPRI